MTRRNWLAARSLAVKALVMLALAWWMVVVVLAAGAPEESTSETNAAGEFLGILVSGRQ